MGNRVDPRKYKSEDEYKKAWNKANPDAQGTYHIDVGKKSVQVNNEDFIIKAQNKLGEWTASDEEKKAKAEKWAENLREIEQENEKKKKNAALYTNNLGTALASKKGKQ